jgi:Mg-chelatase subunit ChlI
VILKTARAQAAFDGRDTITPHDIALAAELALPHRVKAGPFRQSQMGIQALEAHIEQLKGEASVGDEERSEESEQEADTTKKKVVPSILNLAKNPLDPSP